MSVASAFCNTQSALCCTGFQMGKVDVVVTCLTVLCAALCSSEDLSLQAVVSKRNHLSLAGDEENGRGPLNIHRAEAQWMEMSKRGWKKREGGGAKKNTDWNRMQNCGIELAAWQWKQLILQMLIMRMVWGHRVSEAEDLRPLADCLQTHLHVELEKIYTGYGVVYITGCAGKCGWFQHDNDSVFGCFGKKEASLYKLAHSRFCGIFTAGLKARKSVPGYYSPPLSTPTFLATFNVSCWSQPSCFPHQSKLSLNAIRPVRLVSLLAADRMPDSLLRLEQNNAGKDILSFSWSPRVPKKRGCSEKWVLGLPLVPLHLTHPLTHSPPPVAALN